MSKERREFPAASEFPKTVSAFVGLHRPYTDRELTYPDLEGFRLICDNLKRKELEYYIQRNHANNLLEECMDFIKSGANTHTLQEKQELVGKLEEHFGI
jgi:hypothetical protein